MPCRPNLILSKVCHRSEMFFKCVLHFITSSDLRINRYKIHGMTAHQEPRCRKLVLDSGPLLSLSPLRGLAETYLTVPQVLAELKDSRAREHFERLGLLSGVEVKVQSPDAASLAHGKCRVCAQCVVILRVNSDSMGQEDWRLFGAFASRSMCPCIDVLAK